MRILPGRGILAGWFLLAAGSLQASMTVTLAPSFPAPATVGDTVVWEAKVSDAGAGTIWVRFRVLPPGGSFRVAVDYGPLTSLPWTPYEREGIYGVEACARNRDTGEGACAEQSYLVAPRVAEGGTPVIASTVHPQVFLYSAPPCAAGGFMRAEFKNARGDTTSTPERVCATGVSMNFLLAGMIGGAEYSVHHVVRTGDGESSGPSLVFTPPPVDISLNQYQIQTPPPADAPNRVLLQSTTSSRKAVATDLEGNLLWYYPGGLSSLTRPLAGGTFLGILQQPDVDSSYQVVREVDLTGTTLRETNAARVSEQLRAMNKHEISAFHHEADLLPGGRVVVLATTERILNDVQGTGPVDVLGEMVVVLDSDFQVVWAWDVFDHLDPARAAILGETCTVAGGGCPPFYLAEKANDWTHANSVRKTPEGNLILSIRHLDLVIKINYGNGRGNGDILWRLGKDGDFTVGSDAAEPWFSHQHDATVLPGPDLLVTLFDNGNTRRASDPAAASRGQMYLLNERKRVANLVYNVDLGVYSQALGSAQRLPNGNFHFNIGWLDGTASRTVEIDPEGKTVYSIEIDATAYRTFRMESLYLP